MKRIITIALLLFACSTAYSQITVDDFYKKFESKSGVGKVTVGGFIMKCINLFEDTKGVNSVKILYFEDCTTSLKNEFSSDIKKIKDPKFETLVTNNDKGQNTKILVSLNEDIIKEAVVLTSGKDNCLVYITGNIKLSDIKEIANKY